MKLTLWQWLEQKMGLIELRWYTGVRGKEALTIRMNFTVQDNR